MSGRVLVSMIALIALVMGAFLWYSIELAYYYRVDDINQLAVYGEMRAISHYNGIDAASSPLKLRGCFKAKWLYQQADNSKITATPLIAPRWFDCFNARQISQDIYANKAMVILSTRNVPYGFNSYIAYYPNGRGFLWRQLNACGAHEFSGWAVPIWCKKAKINTGL